MRVDRVIALFVGQETPRLARDGRDFVVLLACAMQTLGRVVGRALALLACPVTAPVWALAIHRASWRRWRELMRGARRGHLTGAAFKMAQTGQRLFPRSRLYPALMRTEERYQRRLERRHRRDSKYRL